VLIAGAAALETSSVPARAARSFRAKDAIRAMIFFWAQRGLRTFRNKSNGDSPATDSQILLELDGASGRMALPSKQALTKTKNYE
jgi:hypothetical protein